MATGDTLLLFPSQAAEPPSTNFATFDLRNLHPVLDFDDTTAEATVFSGIMPVNYAGGGVTVKLYVAATSATTGTTVFSTAFESIGTAQDMDSDSFAAANNGTLTMPATSGLLGTVGIAHTSGAQMDSIAVGDAFRLKITRVVADAQDSMVGDAELRFVEIKET